MRRWSSYWHNGKNVHGYGESKKIDAFLNEIKEVCKKHGFSISHEDGQGSFVVDEYNDFDIEWLLAACLEIPLDDFVFDGKKVNGNEIS